MEQENHPSQEPEIEQNIELRESEKIRDEFYESTRRTLDLLLNERQPKIPKEQRVLEEITGADDKTVAHIETVRQPYREAKYGMDTWVVVDFDDVINHTTEYNADIQQRLSARVNISADEFQSLYEQAKQPNADGRKVLRFTKLIQKLEERFPEQVSAIHEAVSGIDHQKYVDEGVRRALQSMHHLYSPNVRVSILTFGDREYQKSRIDASGIEDAVDDIIYTEGSKKDVIQALLKKLYYDEKRPLDDRVRRPFILTIDDSPEQIEDFEQLDVTNRYVNMRFRHPQGKRYQKETQAQEAVQAQERGPNQAAVQMLRAVRLSQGQYFQESRTDLARKMQDLSVYEVGTSDANWEKVINVKFQKDPDGIITISGRVFREYEEWRNWQETQGLIPRQTYHREFQHGRWWDASDDGVLHPVQDDEERWEMKKRYSGSDKVWQWKIGDDGMLKHIDGRDITAGRRLDFEEYIRHASLAAPAPDESEKNKEH